MERVATDVAQPPIRGGELPSFEELLATGSFHARLARARAEREKALAEAGSADDFILDTSRKPWERDEGPRRRPDRLSVALEAAAAAEPARTTRPMLVVPEIEADGSPRQIGAESVPARLPSLLPAVVPVPVGRPALPARRLHVLPVLRPVDADFEEIAAPKRRIAMIEGGFAVGLAIGFMATFVLPWLTASPTMSGDPGPVINAAGPAFADADPFAAPSVAGAPVILPAMLAAAGAARPVLPVLPVSAASEPVPSLVALPLGLTVPAGLAVAVSPVDVAVSAGLPAPLPGRGRAVPADARLASAVPADAVPAEVPLPARPSAGVAPNLAAPATVPEPAPPAPAIAAPLRDAGVAATLASAPTADAPLPAQPAAAASSPRFGGTIIVNAPDSLAENDLARLVADLATSGFDAGDPNRVGITVKQSNVRYFHPEDAAAAEAVAAALGARARDFTDFSPAPPAGTIEVWLAGRGAAPAAAKKTRRASGQAAPTAADQQLLLLRNRILQQLRAGDHL